MVNGPRRKPKRPVRILLKYYLLPQPGELEPITIREAGVRHYSQSGRCFPHPPSQELFAAVAVRSLMPVKVTEVETSACRQTVGQGCNNLLT